MVYSSMTSKGDFGAYSLIVVASIARTFIVTNHSY